jgi:hypothetical protein
MTELSEWADQYRGEVEKQSSARAAQIESLLIAGDYEAIREWLTQWEEEDKAPDSLRSRYREARSELLKERHRQHQRQLYGSVIDKITGASTDSLTGSGADPSQPTSHESIGDSFIMPNSDGTLTQKEQAVVDAYSSVRPELGAIAERNIINNELTGWADIVADMSDEEIAAGVTEGTASNSFMYKRIGG